MAKEMLENTFSALRSEDTAITLPLLIIQAILHPLEIYLPVKHLSRENYHLVKENIGGFVGTAISAAQKVEEKTGTVGIYISV
eukprot:8520872-Ditylum_brightwellii.AAC.1